MYGIVISAAVIVNFSPSDFQLKSFACQTRNPEIKLYLFSQPGPEKFNEFLS